MTGDRGEHGHNNSMSETLETYLILSSSVELCKENREVLR